MSSSDRRSHHHGEGHRDRDRKRKEREEEDKDTRPESERWGKYGPESSGTGKNEGGAGPAPEPEKPNYAPSGALSRAVAAPSTGTTQGLQVTTLKWNEPTDKAMPDKKWRLYVFKDGEMIGEPLFLHRQTAYLLGRDRQVCDIPLDHPSCSKQHAVIQFRKIKLDGGGAEIRPYLLDLESVNGTMLEGEKVEGARYYQLKPKNMLQFGQSTREYIILCPDD